MGGIARKKKPAKGKAGLGKVRKKTRPAKPTVTMAEGVSASLAGAYLNDAIESVTGGLALFDADDRLVICNTRFRDQHPVFSEFIVPGCLFEDMVKKFARAGLYGGTRKAQKEIIKKRLQLHRNTPSSHERQMVDGRWIEIRESRTHDGGTVLLWTNITDRKRAEDVQKGRGKVLERLATGGSLTEVLSLLVASLEETTPDMLGSVLVLDDSGERLRTGAAPSLPEFYNKAIDGIRIGPKVGSCGAAAFSGKAVIVEDIMTHPNWKGFEKIAAKAGLGSCWSQPIISASGDVLGTFAMYYREPKKPTEQSLELIENTAHLAGIAIEHKRMEQAFRDSEERLRGAIDSMQEGFALFDRDDRLVAVNDEYRRLVPLAQGIIDKNGTFEDLLRANVAVGLLSEAIGCEEEFIKNRLVDHRNPGKPTVRMMTTGSWYMMSETRTPDGGIATAVTDITELKNAETALRLSEEKFREIAEVSSDLFWEMDENLRFSYISNPWESANPNAVGDALGKTRWELAGGNPEVDGLWKRHRSDLLARKPFRNFRYSLPGKDGASIYRVTNGVPVIDGNGDFKGYRGSATDITEFVKAGEERRLALAAAEEASRVKSEFLATVSHELRTPLNAILGFAEIISRQVLGTIEKPKYIEYANDIHTSGKYLLELVNDILDISTIEAGRRPLSKEKLSISKTISECAKSISARAGENGITLSTQVPKNLPAIHADSRAIKQVLINLLSNAVKFTPPGGMITVQAEAANGFITIKVSDTGPGIPEDEISNLMAPFAKGDLDPYVAQEGAGLGLAISDSLIKLHDGELKIISPPGQGTTVSITLPQGTP